MVQPLKRMNFKVIDSDGSKSSLIRNNNHWKQYSCFFV